MKEKQKYYCGLVALVFFIGMLVGNPGSNIAAAGSLGSTYEALKSDYPEYLSQLYNEGITDGEIVAFMNTLDNKVALRGPLTESNLNNVLLNSLIDVMLTGGHTKVVNVLLDMFGGEINEYRATGMIPASLLPIRNAIKKNMLGSVPSNPIGGGGGGGVPVTPPAQQEQSLADRINQQLTEGKEIISLSVSSGERELTLSGEDINKLNQAGKTLEIIIGNVKFQLPPGALELANNDSFSISARILTGSEAAEAVRNAGENRKIIGPVYGLQSGTEASVHGLKFKKPITVVMSYANADMTGVDEGTLDIGYFDEAKKDWRKMNGVLDKDEKTITFTTSGFSKYAVISYTPVNIPVAKKTVFKDLTGHWAAVDVEKMAELGLVAGVNDTEFAPNRTITRAEFTALLVRAVGIKAESAAPGRFTDVVSNKWYAQVINAAVAAGLVGGYSSTAFGPDDPVTREQVAVMITRAMAYKGNGTNLSEVEVAKNLAVFTDEQDISGWAKDGVAMAVQEGLVGGRGSGLFAPKANTTRAEAAVMILRMYNKLEQ